MRIITAVCAAMTVGATLAYGHVTIQPKQSAPGAEEHYTMRVPTEKFVPTVRIEVEFPNMVGVVSFASKEGWTSEYRKDSSGKVLGIILTGSIPPGESSAFTFTAKNPGQEGKVVWKVIQIYEDGSKSEWTGAEGSRTPAPVVDVKK